LAVAGATVAVPGPTAHAFDPQPYLNFSLFGTYTFGATQPWGIGLDGRVGATDGPDDRNCNSRPFYYGGGALRFEWFPVSHTRLMLVAQGGRGYAILGGHAEVGIGYRFGTDAGLQTLVGAEFDYALAALALRVEPLRGEFSPSFGALYPSVVFPGEISCSIAGRPLRAEDGVAPLPSITTADDCAQQQRDDHAPAEVIALWGKRAQTELASVPAFRELAEQLHVQGAPLEFVDRCYEAGRDELHHAMLAANHCAVFGSQHVQLESDGASCRAPVAGPEGMVRLAVESWVDGCLGEGVAAACAAEEARLASHDDVRHSQQLIARDEGQHAELAWDVLAWTLRVGGRDVRDALHAVADASPSEASVHASNNNFETFGILSGERYYALLTAHRQRSLQRLHETLVSG
jgi:hypothetical protein